MALVDYLRDMEGCSRCSSCKWVPFNQVKSWRFAKNCPSITRHNFHAYSGSGKMIMGMSMVNGRSELNEDVANIVYSCQLCGACDTACKVYRDDIDLTDVLLALRAYCVEEGELVPEHMMMIDALKKEDNVFGEPKAKRGDWAEGLNLKDVSKDKAQVLFHAGCRYSYDADLWETVQGAVRLLTSAGVDVGIAGADEACCGGRAYELGYQGESENFTDDMLSRVKASGADVLVTACSDCYAAFNYLYPRLNKDLGVEVYHITQYLEKLADEGKLTFRNKVPKLVTYHDPCHLGRKGEAYTGEWKEDKLMRPMSMKRTGKKGVYDAPRNIIEALPGVELVEMERIKGYAWCCGAGGGVLEAFPEFASWTANERIEEALATGAEALVTSCPWCLRMFKDAVADTAACLEVYDLTELALKSAGA
jgi:Fe-S oxidoreductase